MYDFLKDIATQNEWGFEYSRADYQNLFDIMIKDKVCLFVDPIIIDRVYSDSATETLTYSGKFMLLISSDVDENYIDKYEKYIKPLISDSSKIITDAMICNDFNINKFQSLEVINLFDQNLDGILINYSVTIND